MSDNLDYHKNTTNYYGEVLQGSGDLKTSACTAAAPPRYVIEVLTKVPKPVIEKFYGCGSPIPAGIDGCSIVDLGCGSGRDCYVAAALVGPEGRVIGMDMTETQLDTAKANVDEFAKTIGFQPNLTFVLGKIEDLRTAVPQESAHICISNCVVNLTPDKEAVLQGVWSTLKQGGEFYISDVYCDQVLTKEARNDPVLVGECLGGSLAVNDFLAICKRVGFVDPRVVQVSPIKVELESPLLGEAKFYSILFRLFKLPQLSAERHYFEGDEATYKGTIESCIESYTFDGDYVLKADKATPVDANLASILSNGWLNKHFEVKVGSRNVKLPHPAHHASDAKGILAKSGRAIPGCGLSCSSGACGEGKKSC